MSSVREIQVEWNTASGSGKRSIFYFSSTPTAASQRTALFTFLNGIKTELVIGTQFGIQQSGVELDAGTGALTGAWTDATVKASNGSAAGEPVSDATQVLVQWKTPVIINRRFLRGRTYIPGLAVSKMSGGNVSGTSLAIFQAQASALQGSGADLHVWHRPVNGSGGTSITCTNASVWSELAVLRRRRG